MSFVSAPLYKEATKFYQSISSRASVSGHAIDFFGCSLDQVGLLELKSCITATGGLVLLADSFSQSVFKESFRRVFNRWESDAAPSDAGNLLMGFGATLEVLTGREFKISGAIGPCVSLKRASPCVSDNEIGESGTCAWNLGAINPNTTVGLFFEITNTDYSFLTPGKRHYLQLVTYYQHSNGHYRMRVTTCAGAWNPEPKAYGSLIASFDQDAAAVLMSRIAVDRMETEDHGEVLRWLDRSLIRLCSKFAEYKQDDPSSFRLAPNLSQYPQYMFHLRRSPFMQTANSSPDEFAYNRLIFNRETVANALIMIQPSLISYSFSAPPQPVLLDATSVRPDVILLLDTFFHVLVVHGETISAWRDQKYHELPEHEAFRALLQAPKDDAAVLMEERFPLPRYIHCDQHKSQARFLIARLNPSVTHNTKDGTGAAPVFTEDVSFSVFMDHLVKLATAST